jgi:hypothetical protein
MNHPDFRARGRIFASLHQHLKFGMVVLTPAQQARFMAESGALRRKAVRGDVAGVRA